jgi:DNA topoisomerase I
MKGLTAKVFRTYNASITFQRLLDETPLKGKSLQEKLNAYNAANRKVAILCNHQRTAPKTHDQSMAKMRDRVGDSSWRWGTCKLILSTAERT